MPAQCQECSGHTLGQEETQEVPGCQRLWASLAPCEWTHPALQETTSAGDRAQDSHLANGGSDPVGVDKGQGPLGQVGRCRQPSVEVTASSSLISCHGTPPTRPVNQVLRDGPHRPSPPDVKEDQCKQVSSRTCDGRTHLQGTNGD